MARVSAANSGCFFSYAENSAIHSRAQFGAALAKLVLEVFAGLRGNQNLASSGQPYFASRP